MTEYPNPLIPGFNPDPSVVKVGDDYYIVTSTFEYLPGIPVYHSTDFVTWSQIGNVITRMEQAELENVVTAGGVWAPTIRYRDGLFYVIVTIAMGRGCMLYTATDPAGRWSDGIVLEGIEGIDPDLNWDDEGTAYVTFSGLITKGPDLGKHLGIQQVKVDLVKGVALEEPRSLWAGTGLKFPEAPHLYRRGEFWYLMIAEGGTERGHGESIARGTSPEGPFEGFAGNPFLSARSTNRPIQNTGHGDLVETPDGQTSIVLLGMRPRGGTQAFSALGRETFVSSIEWVDGWPVAQPVVLRPRAGSTSYALTFGGEGAGVGSVSAGAASGLTPTPTPAPDAAPVPVLDDGWLAIRRETTSVASLTARPGWLVIDADGSTLDDPSPTFVGRRQLNQTAAFTTVVDAAGGTGGLAARYDEDHHYEIEVTGSEAGGEAGNRIVARARLSGFEQTFEATLPAGPVTLHLDSVNTGGGFSPRAMSSDRVLLWASVGDAVVHLADLDGRYLTAETAASFTGRVVGLYATAGRVAFSSFDYVGSED
ncbi:glycoside hydrolase family 43 protein [Subtercola vilae]|uniref:Glycoside hydrolase family 43 protein n=1 Tax=Subtercola vilae TaxID=2056433 RepID=A0A4T2CEF1_9MICO|nr:glycoside hydrolase family 43 protein [Subtercola vilae]TIH40906.1 glycoside hydrolase family 43 protein [Subtercola vilae]